MDCVTECTFLRIVDLPGGGERACGWAGEAAVLPGHRLTSICHVAPARLTDWRARGGEAAKFKRRVHPSRAKLPTGRTQLSQVGPSPTTYGDQSTRQTISSTIQPTYALIRTSDPTSSSHLPAHHRFDLSRIHLYRLRTLTPPSYVVAFAQNGRKRGSWSVRIGV